MSHKVIIILRKMGVGFEAFSVSWHFFTPSEATPEPVEGLVLRVGALMPALSAWGDRDGFAGGVVVGAFVRRSPMGGGYEYRWIPGSMD
jgi:hypothetical protein